MAKQPHKRFSDEEVKMLLEKYLSEKVGLSWLKNTKRNVARFSTQYEKKDSLRIRKFLLKLIGTAISGTNL